MSRNFVIAFSVGIVIIAVAVAGIFYMQRGAHVDLPGKVLKVRTAPLDEKSSAVVVDFRVSNPSDYPFMARSVTVILEDQSGVQSEGRTASEIDAKRLMEGVPLLGEKYNPSLIVRDKVAPHSTLDRMVAARFELPDSALQSRKRFLLKVEEVDGTIVEISEK